MRGVIAQRSDDRRIEHRSENNRVTRLLPAAIRAADLRWLASVLEKLKSRLVPGKGRCCQAATFGLDRRLRGHF